MKLPYFKEMSWKNSAIPVIFIASLAAYLDR